ncbi:hypothetical protein QFC21_005677 [Naganishia friedmannii]|uniref:Uncharacterized protein n=1 Tax=Naganishia friedmannii TaxID=89922 RepID=A0ACC2V8X1_9TREE|nr:hypothetical protein QFC21_005677 [Naganishia friedmannii]
MPSVTDNHRRKGKGKATQEEPASAVLPLGKQLAHTDKKVRDAAINNLTAFLSNGGITKLSAPLEDASGGIVMMADTEDEPETRHGQLPPVEMRRLWKGLFYCFWMSDKPLVQQRLATDLSEIILQITPQDEGDDDEEEQGLARDMAALDFIQGFWETIIREWVGIDRFRIDKYYMLLRRWINASFRLLARSSWNPLIVQRYLAIMVDPSTGPLTYENPRTSVSLAWHLADIWVDELNKVLGDEEILPAPVPTLLQPFTQLLTRTNNAQTPTRLLPAIYEPILRAALPLSDPSAARERSAKRRKTTSSSLEEKRAAVAHILERSTSGDDEERLGRDVLRSMMDEASKPDDVGVKDVNRRKVYAFVKDWGGVEEEDDNDEEEDDE